jgi:GNAT superfamily N-acetyltransferase
MSALDKPALMAILRPLPEFTPEEVGVAEELIDAYLENPVSSGYYVLIALLDASVAGYICYGPTPMTQGTWDIYWMATASAEQGKGVGGVLLAAAEKDIRRCKGRMALIETSSQPLYEKTRRFHYAQGYRLICRVADFYAPGDDKLILQKIFTADE